MSEPKKEWPDLDLWKNQYPLWHERQRQLESVLAAANAENARLTRELAEAGEAIRDAADQTGGAAANDDERLSYEEIQVDRGWREEWRALPAAQRALLDKAREGAG